MKAFKAPKGAVKIGIGSRESLPAGAQEVKIFMESGNPMIYIVPVSEMNDCSVKDQIEFEDIFKIDF